jgi:hypothetical protein
MVIAFAKIQKLFNSISSAVPDQMDCDGCFELSAQLAEAELNGKELDDLLKAVRVHMSQCPCCAYEYEALLEAVQAADDGME